jgi:hypothetical protein
MKDREGVWFEWWLGGARSYPPDQTSRYKPGRASPSCHKGTTARPEAGLLYPAGRLRAARGKFRTFCRNPVDPFASVEVSLLTLVGIATAATPVSRFPLSRSS